MKAISQSSCEQPARQAQCETLTPHSSHLSATPSSTHQITHMIPLANVAKIKAALGGCLKHKKEKTKRRRQSTFCCSEENSFNCGKPISADKNHLHSNQRLVLRPFEPILCTVIPGRFTIPWQINCYLLISSHEAVLLRTEHCTWLKMMDATPVHKRVSTAMLGKLLDYSMLISKLARLLFLVILFSMQ